MSTALAHLEQTLTQLSVYIGKPLTVADRERAQSLHTNALTECRRAMQELQANQEQRVIEKIETLEDTINTILIEIQQRAGVSS